MQLMCLTPAIWPYVQQVNNAPGFLPLVCLKSVAAADCLFTERLTWDLEGLWGF